MKVKKNRQNSMPGSGNKTTANGKADNSKKKGSDLSPSAGYLNNKLTFLLKYRLWFEIIALILIIAAGISLRVEDLGMWHKYEYRAFFKGEPLHTTFDAWYYLSLAQDLVDGTYAHIDEKRGVPDSPPRPSPPPLISVIAAALEKITSVSLSWIGALLPALLGPLLAIPVYLLGRFYGGPVMGFTAALISVFYPFYIYRSNIGRFDTDCMNVTFATAIAYFFLKFGVLNNRKRYFYFLLAALFYLLFLWWWDQSPAAVTAICILPFMVSLIFFYRPEKKELKIFYSAIAVSIIIFLMATGLDAPLKILKSIWFNYLYITKESSGSFPNIGITISEQSRPSLDLIINYTTRNIFSFLFALAGVIMLIWKKRKTALFLISIIVLSIATFTANRFMIFMIPLLALGTGYSMFELWNIGNRFKPLYLICPVLLVFLCWPLYTANSTYVQWPKEPAITAEAMVYARDNTPKNAVIWTWWDHGYALTYLARRATVNDGSIHSGERTVYTAIPLSTDSYRLSANFMNFYVIRGMKGIKLFYRAVDGDKQKGLKLIKKILAAGPLKAESIIEQAELKPQGQYATAADWLEFFYPRQRRPVYLFIDRLLPKIAYWWYWFGTWDIAGQDGHHPVFKTFYNIQNKGRFLLNGHEFMLNRDTGEMRIGNNVIHISTLGIRGTRTMNKKKYDNNSIYKFYYFERARFGALMDSEIAGSVFNKLYMTYQYKPEYFKPLRLRPPYYEIWKVEGDRLP